MSSTIQHDLLTIRPLIENSRPRIPHPDNRYAHHRASTTKGKKRQTPNALSVTTRFKAECTHHQV